MGCRGQARKRGGEGKGPGPERRIEGEEDMPDFPLIEGQHGLATREQLEQAGFTQGAIRYLGEVLGQRPLPGRGGGGV